MEVSYSAAQPEFDGSLITVPVASREQDEIDPLTGALVARNMPIKERVDKMVRLSLNWARLKKKANREKKVAIIFHHYPPRNDRIGCAAGLDSFESVKILVDTLKQAGYGVEIISQAELGRPRIDVVPRISGFFRDSFPVLVKWIDEAVRMVALLDEPLESNLLKKHVVKDVETYRQEGMNEADAFREASYRVFGCPPGSYGAGVSELVESKNWKTPDDLGNSYIRYSSHAYGEGSYGNQKPAAFRTHLSRMDVTVKNEDSREYDMMSCTDYYNYYGGLIVANKTVRGKLPLSLVGDSSDPRRIIMRTTKEEAMHVLRSRLVNPKWLNGMMRHGYKGAGDISHMMDVALGWDATAEVMDDWMYEKMADKYALDEKMKAWMNKVNPHARQNILDKLLEAISRGMWEADPDMEERLREEYLDIEGEIEGLTE
jgi:cobaltochelatase CobN